MTREALFAAKTRTVTIMGGVEPFGAERRAAEAAKNGGGDDAAAEKGGGVTGANLGSGPGGKAEPPELLVPDTAQVTRDRSRVVTT